MLQDTGSRRRLVDHVEVAMGALACTAPAQDIIDLAGRTLGPGPQEKQALFAVDDAKAPTSFQSQLVHCISNLQRYRDQLPIRAAFTCRSITLSVPVDHAASDASPIQRPHSHPNCMLNFTLTPSEDVGKTVPPQQEQDPLTCKVSAGGCKPHAEMRPSQAGTTMMEEPCQAALRLEFSRVSEYAQQPSSLGHDRGFAAGRRSVDPASSSEAVDDTADRQSVLSKASSVLVHAEHTQPALLLQASTGAARCSILGNAYSMSCAGTSVMHSVRQITVTPSGAKPHTPPVIASVTLQMKLRDVQHLCLCATLAEFDRTHGIVEQLNRACALPVPVPLKAMEDLPLDNPLPEAMEAKAQSLWSLNMDGLAGGGLPGIDWKVELVVARGFSVKVLNASCAEDEASALSGEDTGGARQAVLQLAGLRVEAAGGLECGRSAARRSLRHDRRLPAQHRFNSVSASKPGCAAPDASAPFSNVVQDSNEENCSGASICP